MNDKTQNPAEIYLVPVFDGEHDHVWCDTPAPGEGMREEDATRYVREDIYLALQAQVEKLQFNLNSKTDIANQLKDNLTDAFEREMKLKAQVERLQNYIEDAQGLNNGESSNTKLAETAKKAFVAGYELCESANYHNLGGYKVIKFRHHNLQGFAEKYANQFRKQDNGGEA